MDMKSDAKFMKENMKISKSNNLSKSSNNNISKSSNSRTRSLRSFVFCLYIVFAIISIMHFARADPVNDPCAPILDQNGNPTGYVNPDCTMTLDYKEKMCEGVGFFDGKFAECTAIRIFNGAVKMLVSALNSMARGVITLLLYSPDISGAKGNYDKMLKIVQSLYSVLITCAGLYLILGAKSVEGRVNAKVWGERIIFLILVESVGFFLFGTALKLNSYISSSVLSGFSPLSSLQGAAGTTIAVVIIYLFLVPSLALTVVVLVLRQILIFAVLMLFPFTLMLYLIPPTRQWGSFAMNVTFVLIFIGSLDAILIFSASSLLDSPEFLGLNDLVGPIAAFGVFALLGPINIWIFMNTIHMTSSSPTIIMTGLNSMPDRSVFSRLRPEPQQKITEYMK